MSTSKRRVELHAYRLAELTLLDGDFNVVTKGYPPLTVTLAPGIYLCDAALAGRHHETPLIVQPDAAPMEVLVATPQVQSPLCWGAPAEVGRRRLGRGFPPATEQTPSGISVLRLQLRLGQRGDHADNAINGAVVGGPAAHRILAAAAGRISVYQNKGEHLSPRYEGMDDGALLLGVALAPGPAWLTYEESSEGGALTGTRFFAVEDRCLHGAIALRSTQTDAMPGRDSPAWLHDLSWFYHANGVPWAETLRAMFIAGQPLPHLPWLLHWLQDGSADPMALLYAGHMLLRGSTPDPALIAKLLDLLIVQLGANHPDVFVLAHVFHDRRWCALRAVTCGGAPLLSASWDAIVASPRAVAACPTMDSMVPHQVTRYGLMWSARLVAPAEAAAVQDAGGRVAQGPSVDSLPDLAQDEQPPHATDERRRLDANGGIDPIKLPGRTQLKRIGTRLTDLFVAAKKALPGSGRSGPFIDPLADNVLAQLRDYAQHQYTAMPAAIRDQLGQVLLPPPEAQPAPHSRGSEGNTATPLSPTGGSVLNDPSARAIELVDAIAAQLRELLGDPRLAAPLRAVMESATLMDHLDEVLQDLIDVLRPALGKPQVIAAIDAAYVRALVRAVRVPPAYIAHAVERWRAIVEKAAQLGGSTMHP